MSRYTGPKNKKSRRFGIDLGLKTTGVKLQRRLGIIPGQHGRRGKGKVSDYGQQLGEKQKIKWMFGLNERQLTRYYETAAHNPQATGEVLLQLLERRLDNIVYRLHLAPTRSAARQLVNHGHVLVNGKKVTIPSYRLSVDQVVSLAPKTANLTAVKSLLSQKDLEVPKWLTRKAAVGKITRLPLRADMDIDVNEQLIVEYYSR